MNSGVLFSSALAVTLLTVTAVRGDSKPDFDEDAKPLLRVQPGLLEFVHSHYQVRETGLAKYPGDDDRRPAPPYIFFARRAGAGGPYNLRLLIQPGPPGHILDVVDANKVHGAPPPGASPYTGEPAAPAPLPPPAPRAPMQAPELSGEAPARPPNPAYTGEAPSNPTRAPETPTTPATPQTPSTPAASPSEPTADTPSGPINAAAPSSTGQPTLAPPPDPAPNSQ